ncbi:MAG: alpha/beta hydrolase [Pseudomonadota bacterium]
MNFLDAQTLAVADGAVLALRTAGPASPPRAIVHINHGMAEHSARYHRFAQALAGAGYAVIAHDHRGHGHTKAPDSSLGHFGPKGAIEAVFADLSAVQNHARATWPDVPLISFGHSMGSILAFAHAVHHPQSANALALWNAGVETGALAAIYGGLLKVQRIFLGSDVPSGLAKKLTFDAWNKEFAPNRTAFDWLSRDEVEVDAYIADPLCGFPVTIGLWLDVLTAIYTAADNGRLAHLPKSLPVHLLAGAKDPCTLHAKAVAHIETRMVQQNMTDVTFSRLEDTRHESLNEINRDATMANFITWLDARFKG